MDKVEQIKIIAEYCGWTNIQSIRGELYGIVPDAYMMDSQGAEDVLFKIPNYYEDLNAIHEAEKILPDYWTYRLKFQDVKGLRGNNHEKHFMATAPQRCEAYIRTIGEWKE